LNASKRRRNKKHQANHTSYSSSPMNQQNPNDMTVLQPHNSFSAGDGTSVISLSSVHPVSGGARTIIKPGQKKLQYIYRVYIRNCKQIIKKSNEIAKFIGVYIRN
jgi:hypothetical protein